MRAKILVPPDKMPFTNITKKWFDSGDYPESLRRAVAAINIRAVRERQKRGEPDGRLIGVGLATYCEQAAHGTSVYYGWGIPMVPGFEQATARLTPDGGLELRVGVQSHGQGLETTLAQVAHEILGIDIAKIKVVHGDTAMTPYSTGTWGSRCMVMAGGAVSMACKEIAKRAAKIGAQLLQTDVSQVTVQGGEIAGPRSSISLAEIARAWYLQPQNLPSDVDMGGLEATIGYRPSPDSGTFSYATHAALVAVDPEIGNVEILDYVVIEDGGKLVNPMIVEGQIYGGLAQGIGTALYEEMPFNSAGQPLASTFADYLLPGPTEVPAARIDHMETLSPHTEFGVKGIGEGGAIAPPAAIANAVNDALRPLGAELLVSPLTPRQVLSAIARAGTECTVKAVNFEYARPVDVSAAIALAEQSWRQREAHRRRSVARPDAQSAARPARLLVDITAIPELKRFEQKGDALFIGSCITHADIEDGRVPDVTGGAMRAVAPGSPIAPCAIAAPSAAVWCMPIHRPIGSPRWRRSGRRPSSAGLMGSAAFLLKRS